MMRRHHRILISSVINGLTYNVNDLIQIARPQRLWVFRFTVFGTAPRRARRRQPHLMKMHRPDGPASSARRRYLADRYDSPTGRLGARSSSTENRRSPNTSSRAIPRATAAGYDIERLRDASSPMRTECAPPMCRARPRRAEELFAQESAIGKEIEIEGDRIHSSRRARQAEAGLRGGRIRRTTPPT